MVGGEALLQRRLHLGAIGIIRQEMIHFRAIGAKDQRRKEYP